MQNQTTSLKLVREREPNKVPVLSATERRCYQAAWRIIDLLSVRHDYLATATARRVKQVDAMASIIHEEMKR
jgi:hypothetical protein